MTQQLPADSTQTGRAGTSGLVGWALYDWANTAFATVIQTFVFSAYLVRQVAPDEEAGGAMWGLAIGLGGVAVALCAPVLGATVDQHGRRKPWVVALTGVCVIATSLLWFVKPATSSLMPGLVLVAVGKIA